MNETTTKIFPYLERLLDGEEVEWKTLGEVAEFKRGQTIMKKTAQTGVYPVISGGQQPAYYIDQYNRTGQTITVAGSGAYAGFVMFWDEPIFVSDAFSIKTDEEVVLPRYVFHFLLNKQSSIFNLKRGAGVPHVYAKDLAAFSIPIPPLRVQSRIVEILDKFTQLEAELEAELEARNKQYDFYRNRLLSGPLPHSPNIPHQWEQVPLGSIGEVRMCKRILKQDTTETGEIPFYKIGTFGKSADAFISRTLFEEYKQKYAYPRIGDILISASGTIGRAIEFDGEDAYFQDSNIVWLEHDSSKVINRFLYYCYQIADWKVAKGGTIARLYNDNLKKTLIPLPPLSEQRRIVDILDRFDTLTNSISEGLPREIALRRKQYAYYRDALLSFPRPEVSA